MKQIKYLFILMFVALSVNANTESAVLFKFNEHIDFLLQLNHNSIVQKKNCIKKWLLSNSKKSEVKQDDPICYSILEEVVTDGKEKLIQLRVVMALKSSPIPFFLDVNPNEYYHFPEKAVLSRELKHSIYDIRIQNLELNKLKLEKLTDEEKKQAISRFQSFFSESIRKFITGYDKKNQGLTLEESEDLKARFSKIVMTVPQKRIFKSPIQKIIFSDLLAEFGSFLRSRYQNNYRPDLENEYIQAVNLNPYLTLVNGPSDYKLQIDAAFSKMVDFSKKSMEEQQLKTKDPRYRDLKIKALKGVLTETEVKEIDEIFYKNFDYKKIADFFSKDLEDKSEQNNFQKSRKVYNKNETIKLIGTTSLLVASTVLCFIPVGKATGPILRLFNFARSVEFKLFCSVGIFTPVSVGFLYSNYTNYERIYRLFYSRSESQGLFADFDELDTVQKSYLIDLFLAPLNILAIGDIISSSKIISEKIKIILLARIATNQI